MKNGLIVGALTCFAALNIYKQGHLDFINSIIILLGFIWLAGLFTRNRLRRKQLEKMKAKAEQEKNISNTDVSGDVIDVTDETVIQESEEQ